MSPYVALRCTTLRYVTHDTSHYITGRCSKKHNTPLRYASHCTILHYIKYIYYTVLHCTHCTSQHLTSRSTHLSNLTRSLHTPRCVLVCDAFLTYKQAARKLRSLISFLHPCLWRTTSSVLVPSWVYLSLTRPCWFICHRHRSIGATFGFVARMHSTCASVHQPINGSQSCVK